MATRASLYYYAAAVFVATTTLAGVLPLDALETAGETSPASEAGGGGGGTLDNNIDITTGRLPSGVVDKQVVSSRFRLVFAVGLEGTGHHYFIPALENVFHQHTDLVRINTCKLLPPHYVADVMQSSPAEYAQALALATEGMRELAASVENLEAPGSFSTPQQSEITKRGCFRVMSYPNYGGDNKVFQYLDLTMLAQAAEEAGVDLRLVYLQRSAKAILLANGSHRDLQS